MTSSSERRLKASERLFKVSRPVKSWASLVLLLALFFAPLARSGRAFVNRDLVPYAAGQDALLREAVLERRQLPDRDPYTYLGVPHLADPSTQSLYPPRILTALLFPVPRSLDVAIVLHFALAALGAFRLARALRASRPASVAGAAVYALSGPVLSLQENLPLLAGAAWLPWAWAFALESRPRLMAVTIALTVLGGDLQTATWAMGVGLATLFSCRAKMARERSGLVDASGRSLGALALSLGLAAILLVPAARLRPLTDRSGPLPEATAGRWHLAPARALELVVPFPTGVSFPDGDSVTAGIAPEPGITEPWCETLHTGLLGLVLGLTGLASPARRRAKLALVAVAVAGFVLALGPGATPADDPLAALNPWRILRAIVPFYGVFRYPEKHVILVALGLSGLAALGVDALRTAVGRRRAAFALLASAVVFALGFTLFHALRARESGALLACAVALKGAGAQARALALVLTEALEHQLIAAVVTLAFAGMALLAARRRRRATLLLAAALVALDVAHANQPRLFLGDAALYDARPVGAELVHAAPAAERGRLLRWPWSTGDNVGFHDPGGPAPRRERAIQARVVSWTGNVATRERVAAVQGFSSFVPLALPLALPPGPDLPDAATLDRLQVRWLVLEAALAQEQGLAVVASASTGAVLVDRGPRPSPDLNFGGDVPGLALGALISLVSLVVLVALGRAE